MSNFSYNFIRRLMADKPCRLDEMILCARYGREKVRFSQLQRIIREQNAEVEAKRKQKEVK
jgi:hypothetical protein